MAVNHFAEMVRVSKEHPGWSVGVVASPQDDGSTSVHFVGVLHKAQVDDPRANFQRSASGRLTVGVVATGATIDALEREIKRVASERG